MRTRFDLGFGGYTLLEYLAFCLLAGAILVMLYTFILVFLVIGGIK